jgi:hypothetical protein
MFLVGVECVDRIRMGMPKAHSRNVSDLPVRLFVRDCTRTLSARPLVCPCSPPAIVISWGMTHPGLLMALMVAATPKQIAMARQIANSESQPSEQFCSDRGRISGHCTSKGRLGSRLGFSWRRPRARIRLHSSRIRLFLSHPTLASQATSGAGVSCRRGGRRSYDDRSRPPQVRCAGHTRR